MNNGYKSDHIIIEMKWFNGFFDRGSFIIKSMLKFEK